LNLFAAPHAVWLFQIIGAALCASATHRRIRWRCVGRSRGGWSHNDTRATVVATSYCRTFSMCLRSLLDCVCGVDGHERRATQRPTPRPSSLQNRTAMLQSIHSGKGVCMFLTCGHADGRQFV
jgi:hypothetical protein